MSDKSVFSYLALLAASLGNIKITDEKHASNVKKCRKCGAEFIPARAGHYLCDECFKNKVENDDKK